MTDCGVVAVGNKRLQVRRHGIACFGRPAGRLRRVRPGETPMGPGAAHTTSGHGPLVYRHGWVQAELKVRGLPVWRQERERRLGLFELVGTKQLLPKGTPSYPTLIPAPMGRGAIALMPCLVFSVLTSRPLPSALLA